MCGGPGSLGPAWTRGEMERPEGEKNMGTWTAAVYTEEQQRRLGVNEMGEPLEQPANQAGPAGEHRETFTVVRDGGQPVTSGGDDGSGDSGSGGGGDGASRFPSHWGAPPMVQTRDLRPLPGGYGMGSGTLKRWIEEKMAADAASSGQGDGSAASETKSCWPELVGADGDAAMAAILSERPELQVSTMPHDAMMTMDFREDRVRVMCDAAGKVTAEPRCG
jgi:hypothetical protein